MIVASRLSLVFKTGVDPDGKDIERVRNYSVATNVTDEQLNNVAGVINEFSNHELVQPLRVDSKELGI